MKHGKLSFFLSFVLCAVIVVSLSGCNQAWWLNNTTESIESHGESAQGSVSETELTDAVTETMPTTETSSLPSEASTSPGAAPSPTASATPATPSASSTGPASTNSSTNRAVTIGMLLPEVISILGQPYKIEGTQSVRKYIYRKPFAYGSPETTATLFMGFNSEKDEYEVAGWYDQSALLKISLGEKSSSAPAVTLGSSPQDVIKAMGTPCIYDPSYYNSAHYVKFTYWEYTDRSRIDFNRDDNTVIGWSNNGSLKVNLGTVDSHAGPVRLGSTLDEVTSAFGTPTLVIYNANTVKPNRIDFGSCSIGLDSNLCVISWSEKGSLNINIGDKDPTAPPFAVGSSFADVIRAMGTPDTLNSGSFDLPLWIKYGQSVVDFNENAQTVTSWENKGELYVAE
jgi:hypothetical protein